MQLFETPDNRVPEGAAVYAAQTRNKKRLRAMTAPALTPEGKGTVVILNGRADFVERYFETMGELQRRGYHIAGFDWRGQGGSQRLMTDGMRGHIRSYREYDEDLRAVMEGVVTKNCPGPYYAIGHSTGGHILLRSLSRHSWFEKVIVTSPLMELQYGSWPKGLAFFLASLATAFGFGWGYLPGFKRLPFLLRGFDDNLLTTGRTPGTWCWRPDLCLAGGHHAELQGFAFSQQGTRLELSGTHGAGRAGSGGGQSRGAQFCKCNARGVSRDDCAEPA
jgi:lysophospholipase